MPSTPQGYTIYLPPGGSHGQELRFPDKSVKSQIPYTLDYSQWLAEGDSIVGPSVQITSSPNGLTIAPLPFTDSALTWMISGGIISNPACDYFLDVQFSTESGIFWEETVWLRVWPLSPNKTFATDLILIQGPPGDPADITDLPALPNSSFGLLPTDTFALVRAGVVYSLSAADFSAGFILKPSLNFAIPANTTLIPLL